MLIRIFLPAIMLMSLLTTGHSQGFTAPQDGKAAIYFTRVTVVGALIPFDFFHGDRYIGQASGKKYLRYECDPGEHLFWASSENKAFITANVEANRIYVVIVDVAMGIGIARVGLTPIDEKHKVFPRAKELVDKKPPVVVTEDHLRTENIRLADFIREKLETYEKKWKHDLEVKKLTPDMALTLTSGLQVPPISH
jgi:hypothetical protein